MWRAVARVMRGASAVWLWPSQHTHVPAFDMACAVPAEPDLRAPDQSGIR